MCILDTYTKQPFKLTSRFSSFNCTWLKTAEESWSRKEMSTLSSTLIGICQTSSLGRKFCCYRTSFPSHKMHMALGTSKITSFLWIWRKTTWRQREAHWSGGVCSSWKHSLEWTLHLSKGLNTLRGKRWIRTQSHDRSHPSLDKTSSLLIILKTDIFKPLIKYLLLYLWIEARKKAQESCTFSQDSGSRTEGALKGVSHWKLKDISEDSRWEMTFGRGFALVQQCS